ncbi:hypothetical protein SNE40_014968 [Patella caerulea]|uniref:Uncharacterized protein n=1 Tax=Patella caerulea TaxID=87958 RepID=A0AAN8JGS2_PATCE
MSDIVFKVVDQLELVWDKFNSYIPSVFWETIEYMKLAVVNADIQLQILIILGLWLIINICLITFTWKKYENNLDDNVIIADLSRQSSLYECVNGGSSKTSKHLKKD